MGKDLHLQQCAGTLAGWSTVVPASGQAQQCSLCAVPSAGVSMSKDGRDPQLHMAAVAVGAVGVFSGESCWAPPDLLFSHGDAVVKGIPLGARFSYGHSQG